VHEIKHDGYRLIVRRHGKAVRLFTRRGYVTGPTAISLKEAVPTVVRLLL
jgi:ATP-dependent DNA ligase